MMDVPATTANLRTGALPAAGSGSLLRQSISAHGIFLAIVAAYYASFLILLRLYPDIVPADFLMSVIGFTMLSAGFIILCVFILRVYHIATRLKPERPIPALLKDMKQFLTNKNRQANGLPI